MMSARAKQAILGFLFWLAFGVPVVLALIFLPFAIIAYACGADNIRPWVYRTGKALDQTVNAALFGGHPKDTVSSHCGRWYIDTSGRRIPLRFKLVKWLTGLFEQDHAIKAIEEPFLNEPL